MKVLVVGLGSMGSRRVRNLTHLGNVDVAAYEPSAERRDGATVPAFATFDAALEWGPDALVISTPPDRHAEYALAAARRGLHFFVEASVVTEGMEAVIEAARGRDLVAAPSCTMRFHPAVGVLKRRLQQGAIGRPLLLTHHVGQYLPDWHPWEDYRTFYVAKRETGAAREIVPFELNWLTYLFGPVTHANCMRAKLSALEVDIDDVYSTLLRFESGLQASMVIEVVSRPAIRHARIVGEEGTLVWDWTGAKVLEYRAATGAWEEFADPEPIRGPGGEWVAENMYIAEMDGYLSAIRDGTPWPLSLEDDHALLMTTAALEAASDEQVRSIAV